MPPVHVVGAGGIGCAVGYALRSAGVPVLFVEASPAKVAAGRRDGVRVDHHPPLSAEFVHFDDWRPSPGLSVLLCTKCYDNAAVLAKLPPGAELIPIQNGFDPQLLAFGHTWEGIASFVSECAPDRPHTRITRAGELHVGKRSNQTNEKAALASPASSPPSLLGKGVGGLGEGRSEVPNPPTPFPKREGGGREDEPMEGGARLRVAGKSSLFRLVEVSDIDPIKHTKLMYNAAISPLAAAAGIDNGQLLSVPEARQLFFALLQENHRILMAAGIELGKVGPFHPSTVAWILRRRWLARVMAKFFEPSLRGTYCSMAGEIQKGRTEMANYNGHLIRLAEATGTPCPLNRAVYDRVIEMSAERTQPTHNVLKELVSGGRRPPVGSQQPETGGLRPPLAKI